MRAPNAAARWATSGITAQRYSLVLYGTSQRLKLESWEPETTRTVTVPFAWKPDTWYRLKLRVENAANGAVRVQGKAWPVGQPEPAAWTIDKLDPIGNRQGAPGLFIDAQFGAYSTTSRSRRISNELTMHNARLSICQLVSPALSCCVGPVFVVADARRAACSRVRSRHRRLADVGRHAGSQHGLEHEGPADRVGRQDEEEREVGGRAGLAELRQSGRGGRHGVRRHEQRAAARSEAARRPRRADGVPRIGRRVPVAAHAREARVRPRERLAVPGRRVVAARRWATGCIYTSNRGGRLLPRHSGFSRQGKRRPGDERDADRPDRRRCRLVVRHDGGSRRLSRTTWRTPHRSSGTI